MHAPANSQNSIIYQEGALLRIYKAPHNCFLRDPRTCTRIFSRVHLENLSNSAMLIVVSNFSALAGPELWETLQRPLEIFLIF